MCILTCLRMFVNLLFVNSPPKLRPGIQLAKRRPLTPIIWQPMGGLDPWDAGRGSPKLGKGEEGEGKGKGKVEKGEVIGGLSFISWSCFLSSCSYGHTFVRASHLLSCLFRKLKLVEVAVRERRVQGVKVSGGAAWVVCVGVVGLSEVMERSWLVVYIACSHILPFHLLSHPPSMPSFLFSFLPRLFPLPCFIILFLVLPVPFFLHLLSTLYFFSWQRD